MSEDAVAPQGAYPTRELDALAKEAEQSGAAGSVANETGAARDAGEGVEEAESAVVEQTAASSWGSMFSSALGTATQLVQSTSELIQQHGGVIATAQHVTAETKRKVQEADES